MLREILPRVRKPGRYLGCEVNSIIKNKDEVRLRVALAFPDVYELAFSHLGLKIIYHVLNARDDIWAERVYCPWADMEEELRLAKLPLYALESKDPICEFDLIGFTLQYELSATNILTMLELGGIPLRSVDRDSTHPVVIAGGPNTSNPEPFADFFDAFVLGDGEEVVLEISDAIIKAKQENKSRKKLLLDLSKIEGVYVPSLFETCINESGNSCYATHINNKAMRVKKAIVTNLDTAHYISKPLLPTVEPTHDRFAIEIQRGCSRGCRFCQAGMIYRPTRQRKPETVINLARQGLKESGQETLGLLSLSASDYECLGQTAQTIFEEYKDKHVSIQLPSLRVEGLSDDLIYILNQERKTGFTLAPEAATNRLRKVINKGNTEEDLLKNLEKVYKSGWKQVKLYFMIGLPTETEEDIWAIIDLAKKIRILGRSFNKANQLTVSVSTFVPKSHTPFQWCSMLPLDEIARRQYLLKDNLRAAKIKFKWHDRYTSILESAFARGDRRLCDVIENAHKKGARFDAWTDFFNFDLWREAFDEAGLDLEEYATRSFDIEDKLAWSHLDYLLDEKFLKDEYAQALNAEDHEDCTYGRCTLCGVCDHKIIGRDVYAPENSDKAKLAHVKEVEVPKPVIHKASSFQAVRYIRFKFEKQDYSIYLGHLDLMSQIARAFRRSQIQLKFSEGFHPKPKLGFSPALPLGVSSKCEFFDAEVLDLAPVDLLKSKLNTSLPIGVKIIDTMEISQQTPSLNSSISAVEYEFDFKDLLTIEQKTSAIEYFDNSESIEFKRETKKGTRHLELKSLVEKLKLTSNGTVICKFIVSQSGSLKPLELLREVFKTSDKDYFRIKIEKIGLQFMQPKKYKNKLNFRKSKEKTNGSKSGN